MKNDLQEIFYQFSRHLLKRPTLPWLYRKNQPYPIGYYALGEVGSTKFKRQLNKALCKVYPLWKRGVLPKIQTVIHQHLNRLYLDRLGIKPEVIYFKKWLNICLEKLHVLTYQLYTPELVWFLSESLKVLYAHTHTDFDCFKHEKEIHQKTCCEILDEVQQDILSHPKALEIWVYLSIRANWIDSFEEKPGEFLQVFENEIDDLINNFDVFLDENQHDFFQWNQVISLLKKQKLIILYEVDNAGEFAFDLALIQYLMEQHQHKIIVSCKQSPILNDVTLENAKKWLPVSMKPFYDTTQLQFISSGSGIPGKWIYGCSDDYKTAYEQCHFVILKGQGHLESFPKLKIPYKKPHVHLGGLKSELTQLGLKQHHQMVPILGSRLAFVRTPKLRK